MLIDYLTPEQVAQRLQVTERTVYSWLRSGRLHGIKMGRLWRIPDQSVETFLSVHDVIKAESADSWLQDQVPVSPQKTTSKPKANNPSKKKKHKR